MSISVGLVSKTKGELKRFLSRYFNCEYNISPETVEWMFTYRDSVEAHDLVMTLMDNYADYKIKAWIKQKNDDVIYLDARNMYQIMNNVLA